MTGANWPWMYDEQGPMYAVYDFLERECGVVWANPSDYGTGFRKDPNLAVAPASRRCRPWMSYRGGAPLDREVVTPLDWKRGSDGERRYNEFAYAHPKAKGLQDKLYMLRNRLGGDFAKANHSFYWWYDRFWNEKSKTFEAFRPDYFAKGYDGQPPQLCYMNPEVVAKTVDDVRRYFDDADFRRSHFNDTGRDHFIWGENNSCLEPMDNSSFCKCRDCTRLYEPERRGDNSMHSTYWFTFVNAVAREIGRSHPSKRITTLAYMGHEGLPNGVALEDNVTVYFCVSANRMPNSADHPKQFASMAEWRRAYPRQPLAMWLYNCFPMEIARNGNWHCFPGFFAHEAERQYRFFVENDIRGGVLPCDVWEFVVERQEAQPCRYYMTGCDGRMDALSYGEVNWRQGVPSRESGLVNYGAKCVTDRTAPDRWTARWAFPLATLADAPLKAGDSFHLNCIRVASNAIGGRRTTGCSASSR